MDFPRIRTRTPLYLMLAAAGFSAVTWGARLRINTTESLPLGLYREVPGLPGRGALVTVCLPMQARGYGRPGSCPDGRAPLLKRVVAVAGDTVVVSKAAITVNGQALPNTARRARDSQGRQVTAIPAGRYQVGLEQVWLIANYSANSWDSRYFGAVPTNAVEAVVNPVWIWGDQ